MMFILAPTIPVGSRVVLHLVILHVEAGGQAHPAHVLVPAGPVARPLEVGRPLPF